MQIITEQFEKLHYKTRKSKRNLDKFLGAMIYLE
jgi:hypothetical protein